MGYGSSAPKVSDGSLLSWARHAVFRYSPLIHNVVAVGEEGYNGCTTPPGSRTYESGNDAVRLARGDNHFMCTRFYHCNLGMKMVVNAA